MPDLNSLGARLDGRGLMYLTDDTVVGQVEVSPDAWRVSVRPATGGPWRPVSPHGATMVAARAGRWLGFLAGFGLFDANGLVDPYASLAGDVQHGCGVAASDGTVAVITDYQAGRGLKLSSADGSSVDFPTAQPSSAVCVISHEAVLWWDYATREMEVRGGLPTCHVLPGPVYWPRAMFSGDEWWIAYHSTDTMGVVLHPFADASWGYRIALPPAFYLAGVALDDTRIKLAWSRTPDDLAGSDLVIDVARDQRVRLTPQQPVPLPAPTPPEAPQPMPQFRDTLQVGEHLSADQELRSYNGRFRLIYQLDGNLVLYDRDWIALWASGTDGTDPGRVIMQDDGNCVVYDRSGVARWASNTDGRLGARLVMQDDGNLVIYSAGDVPIWASNTVQPDEPLPHPDQLYGRIRVESGRFRDDLGFLGLRFLSEFDAVHRIRTSDEADIVRRLDRAAAAKRNGVRVLMMARNLFDLQPSQPGYWSAADRAVTFAWERGLYSELCLFADAQHVMPAHADRIALTRDFAAFCREHETVLLPQLVNEPTFNGFESAVDPRLLSLADLFKAEVGHLDFSIGDPMDEVTDESTGEPLGAALRTLAAHSNVLVLHGDRKEDSAIYARWVNHLKGFEDFRSHVRQGVALLHDEPMGMAGARDVPLPNGHTYRREDRADALVAAACVSAILQIGFTTHYISAQDDRVPGLMESAVAALIPQRPDMRYVNAGLPGSPIVRFNGWDKVRTCTDGVEGWAVAYGVRKGALMWGDGWRVELAHGSEHVELWRAVR